MNAGAAIRRLRAVLGGPATPLAQPPLCFHLAEKATCRRFLPEASADAVLSASPGGLRMRARGGDPFVYGPVTAVDLQAARLVRITADFLGQRGHGLKVYFSTDQAPLWCEEQSLEVKVPAAAGPVPLLFDFSTHERWVGRFLRLRIDLERMRRDDAEVELRTVELLPPPLPAPVADVPVASPPADDGIVLRDERGRPCVRISPEVVITTSGGAGLRRTSIPLASSRRIDGVEVRADLAIGPMEGGVASWTLTIAPAAPIRILDVSSPVFRLGPGSDRRPALAVLPGVEMSAALPLRDLLPEPGLLSWRCAYLEEDGAAVAVTWENPEVTPRFVPGSLSLHVPPRPGGRSLALAAVDWDAPLTWSGRIVIASAGSRARALATVAGPVPPAPAVDAAAVAAQAAAALDGPFRGPQGLTLPRLGAPAGEEYFEVRACLSLLACGRLGLYDGEGAARAQVARYLEDAAAPVPLGIGLLFPECLDRALATLDRQARELASSLHADGTWPPRIPAGCHAPDPRPFARSASAIARPVALLLWAAACGLGDAARVEASLGRLRDPALLPTGGQDWEFAPDVPELLGAADVADAFLLAHELGLDPRGLSRAADWLMLGLTFFHLDGDPPFACCPALGVTRSNAGGLVWYSHAPDDQLDWRGLSCPWIGLRFADTLERFRAAVRRFNQDSGQEEDLAEVLRPMAAVSRGALAHALTLTGPHGSLLDGFDLRTGVETEPLYRAPTDIAWHALRLLSAGPDPALARHGDLTAVGAGRFAVDGEALLFTAAIPGPQAILVADRRGVSWKEIDGSSTVRVEPP